MGPSSQAGSCRHCWLTGPAPSPGRQSRFPQPGLHEPTPSFQLPLKELGPAFPGTCSLNLTVREFSCAVFQAGKASRDKGQGEKQLHPPDPKQPPVQGRETQRTETILSGKARPRKESQQDQAHMNVEQLVPNSSSPFPQGGLLRLTLTSQQPCMLSVSQANSEGLPCSAEGTVAC